jgi:hypothetical protein
MVPGRAAAERITVRVVDFEPGVVVTEYASMPDASASTLAALMYSGPDISITRVSGP